MIPGKERLLCFKVGPVKDSVMIKVVDDSTYQSWLSTLSDFTRSQLSSQDFQAKPKQKAMCYDETGALVLVCYGACEEQRFWSAGVWVNELPEGIYQVDSDDPAALSLFALAWGMGAYRFDRYSDKNPPSKARLHLPVSLDFERIETILCGIYWIRDMINTAPQDMMPKDLVMEAKHLAKEFKATCSTIEGDKLLSHNFPAVHAVGRGSHCPPAVVDLRWGKSHLPKVTLVGKGVCFDTGGLDLKNAQGMLWMKKDMGGAAHALGLAYCIMAMELPVCLRVLIPAVENGIAAGAYHPGDVIPTRAGISVEIGNTDAEGRLILADCLTAASEEDPDLLIDLATLTGAQRVALGEDIPAFFAANQDMMSQLMEHSRQVQDPAWPLPLYFPYKSKLKSKIADINNIAMQGPSFGGAITAALFLSEFVPNINKWVHIDFNAWNEVDSPGRPQGGEAMALRMLLSFIQTKFHL